MSFMPWTDDFSIGIAMFDDEHKKLVRMINELHACIAAGNNEQTVRRVCDELVEYTVMHFGHEEMYFYDVSYPDATEHAAIHADMKRKVLEYREKIGRNDSSNLAIELLSFLRSWLANHILVEDRKYSEFLKAHHIH